jgi:hypothetical protein
VPRVIPTRRTHDRPRRVQLEPHGGGAPQIGAFSHVPDVDVGPESRTIAQLEKRSCAPAPLTPPAHHPPFLPCLTATEDGSHTLQRARCPAVPTNATPAAWTEFTPSQAQTLHSTQPPAPARRTEHETAQPSHSSPSSGFRKGSELQAAEISRRVAPYAADTRSSVTTTCRGPRQDVIRDTLGAGDAPL